MKRVQVNSAAIVSIVLLMGCQSKDRQAYDRTLSCVEAANAMIAGSGTARMSSAPYANAEKLWFGKAVDEGAKIGKAKSDVRKDISDRLDQMLARITDSAGNPDMNKVKSDLLNQEKTLRSCSA